MVSCIFTDAFVKNETGKCHQPNALLLAEIEKRVANNDNSFAHNYFFTCLIIRFDCKEDLQKVHPVE